MFRQQQSVALSTARFAVVYLPTCETMTTIYLIAGEGNNMTRILEYRIISYDPMNSNGDWRGTEACSEKLSIAAEQGWIVTQAWERSDTGTWFFLMVRERP